MLEFELELEPPPPQATKEADAPSAAMVAVFERKLRLEVFAILSTLNKIWLYLN